MRLATTSKALTLALSLLATAACGPGRQAAWEKNNADAKEAQTSEADTDAAAGGDEAAAAEAAWNGRIERAQLEKAIRIWEKMAQANPQDSQLLTRLSRAYYLMADGYMRLAGEEDAMLATFEKGILAGENAMMASSEAFAEKVRAGAKVEEAVQLIPESGIGAIYWYSSNLGKFATQKGFTTILFYKERIFAVMMHVLGMNPNFFHGAPHRYFGVFYAKAPAFAGGDLNKSKEHFEKSLEIAPNYLGTKVLFAEFYSTAVEDEELFTRLLTEVEGTEEGVIPGLEAEQRLEKAKAKAFLAQKDEIF